MASEPFAPIDLSTPTEVLERFHRTLMDRRRAEVPWHDFDAGRYAPQRVDEARRQWLSRARAEYASTAQFAQLLHRLTQVGAPVAIIGAATRLVRDECRHAEYCARMTQLLGHRAEIRVGARKLSLFEREPDPWLAIYRTVLTVCCFGEAISVPVLRALHVVATDPLPRTLCEIIAADEEFHARFGWETLAWLTPRLDAAQRDAVASRLPLLFGHFEAVCGGNPQMLTELAGQALDIEPEPPNLGTLTQREYAAIFYHALTDAILPRLSALGFEAEAAWQRRLVPSARAAAAARREEDGDDGDDELPDEIQELSTGRPGEE